jgi:hypothetical protein
VISHAPSPFQAAGREAPREEGLVLTEAEVRAADEHQERAPSFPRARSGGAPVHAARAPTGARAFATRDTCAFVSATVCPA